MPKIELDKLHTTEMGAERIKRNLGLDTDDVVAWCRQAILLVSDESTIKTGKNWYVYCGSYVLTINAHSHTIITAHKKKGLNFSILENAQ